MKVQRLQIEQQMAQIHIASQRASLSIEMPKRTMRVERKRARMAVDRRNGKIELNMRKFRDNIGLKGILSLAAENAARAKAKAERGIREIVRTGDRIGTLPGGENPVASAIREKMLEPETVQSDWDIVPAGAVEMEGKPGALDINWLRHDLKIAWDEYQTPIITVEPKPAVYVEIVREPNVEYTVVELTIPAETGRSIDAKA
jgi:hypothetical protein